MHNTLDDKMTMTTVKIRVFNDKECVGQYRTDCRRTGAVTGYPVVHSGSVAKILHMAYLKGNTSIVALPEYIDISTRLETNVQKYTGVIVRKLTCDDYPELVQVEELFGQSLREIYIVETRVIDLNERPECSKIRIYKDPNDAVVIPVLTRTVYDSYRHVLCDDVKDIKVRVSDKKSRDIVPYEKIVDSRVTEYVLPVSTVSGKTVQARLTVTRNKDRKYKWSYRDTEKDLIKLAAQEFPELGKYDYLYTSICVVYNPLVSVRYRLDTGVFRYVLNSQSDICRRYFESTKFSKPGSLVITVQRRSTKK